MNLKIWTALCVLGATATLAAQTATERPWMDKSMPEEQRVEALLKAMNLTEKVEQLNQLCYGTDINLNNIKTNDGTMVKCGPPGSYLGVITDPVLRNKLQREAVDSTRLGIPIIFGYDVIHGLKTTFPVPVAQGASFNPALTKASSAIAAAEARLMGINWTFSPMVDIAHDPRWGRIVEGYGEDPVLTSAFAVAAVQGYQGDNPKEDLKRSDKVVACLKHFAGYGASEGGRDYHYTGIPRNELWDTYLPAYTAAIKAGCGTVMCAFNDLAGTPTSANRYLETDVLRGMWKFDGFIVGDWESVLQLKNQGYARDLKHCAELAINAGTDMDMVDKIYVRYLPELIKEGKVTEATLDEAVRRVLRIKFRCGLFETPYATVLPESERYFKPEAIELARKSAVETFVLLENANNILPINTEKVKSILVVGPAADHKREMLGNWIGHGDENRTVTLIDALQKDYGDKVKVKYVKGWEWTKRGQGGVVGFAVGVSDADIPSIVDAAKDVDLVIACVGEPEDWSAENRSRAGLYLPGNQNEMLMELKKIGKPIVSLLFTGRPLEIETVKACSDALMVTWFPGTEAGNAMCDVLFGKESPSGKLNVSFPKYVGQVPMHYRRRPPSRPAPMGHYIDMSNSPSYVFGDGITYTTFKYDNFKVNTQNVRRDTKVTASIDVTNTGKVAAKETALWFINDPVATIPRPMKELKHFEKAEIAPGETKTFTFEFTAGDVFSYPDCEGNPIFEDGEIHLMVGKHKITLNCIVD